MTTLQPMPERRGWLCPRCDRVNAPYVTGCPCNARQSRVLQFDADPLGEPLPDDVYEQRMLDELSEK